MVQDDSIFGSIFDSVGEGSTRQGKWLVWSFSPEGLFDAV